MYNVVFYDKTKEVETSREVSTKVWNEETQTYDKVIETITTTITYRLPSKFVFTTATSCDRFFINDKHLEEFIGEMPSLNSAVSMFENSKVTLVSGDKGEPALFPSVTIADNMFKRCESLTSININLSSLSNVNGLVDGCINLTSFTGSLGALEHGESLFETCSKLDTFNADLGSLINGKKMFKGTLITTFENKLPYLLDGNSMFESTPIIDFSVSMPKLKTGDKMFKGCESLTSYESSNHAALTSAVEMFKDTISLSSIQFSAPNLKYADSMFENSGITTFSGDLTELSMGNFMFSNSSIDTFIVSNLDNLVGADSMFTNTSISHWNIDLPLLESGYRMFKTDTKETGIKEFSGALSSLRNGAEMFSGSGLQKFTSNLPKLSVAYDMFSGCSLDAESLMYILESISSTTDITIGINCEDNDEARDIFAAASGVYHNWADIEKCSTSKNLYITWEFNPIV